MRTISQWVLETASLSSFTAQVSARPMRTVVKLESSIRSKASPDTAGQNELSVENPKLGQGVFTNALVNGLKGDADRDGDRRVSLKELASYLKREVPKQATSAGGQQTPVLRFDKTAAGVSLTR